MWRHFSFSVKFFFCALIASVRTRQASNGTPNTWKLRDSRRLAYPRPPRLGETESGLPCSCPCYGRAGGKTSQLHPAVAVMGPVAPRLSSERVDPRVGLALSDVQGKCIRSGRLFARHGFVLQPAPRPYPSADCKAVAAGGVVARNFAANAPLRLLLHATHVVADNLSFKY